MWAYELPSGVESVGTDVTKIAAWLAALATIATVLLNKRSPFRRILGWLWRRNVSDPVSAAAATLIAHTVRPMIDGARSAALAQHDEQNATMTREFGAVNGRLDAIDGRLDKGAEQIAANTADISTLKGKRPTTARQRATDKE
jgi:hypothetical protein